MEDPQSAGQPSSSEVQGQYGLSTGKPEGRCGFFAIKAQLGPNPYLSGRGVHSGTASALAHTPAPPGESKGHAKSR